MAFEEERDDEEYNKLPLKVRLTIRITIYVITLLAKLLKPLNLTPRFSIYAYEPEKPKLHIVEDKEPLQ